MSKRLQVLLEPREYRGFQRIAREAGMSLGEWVRQALRRFSQEISGKTVREKLEAIQRASTFKAPTCDIDQMLDEIEKGRWSS